VGFLLAWRDDVSIEAENGSFAVRGPGGRVTLRDLGPQTTEAFQRLTPPGEDEDQLTETIAKSGPGNLQRWFYYVERLTRRGLVSRSVHENGTPLATVVTVSPQFVWKPLTLRSDRPYVLSRFAYLHREGSQSILESPLAHARVLFHDWRAAAIIGALAEPITAAEVSSRPGLAGEVGVSLLTLLFRAGMVCEAGAEEQDADLRTWAFHDLLFHARSRKGRSDAPYGGTYRFVGESAPPPALKPLPAGEVIPLDRPVLARLEREDPPLTWVQERRRSVRTFDANRPITLHQLGEFLFRVNRVKEYRKDELETVRGPVVMDLAPRPYPAGGGLYELEIYAVVNACDGLAPGLYYHNPSQHQFIRVQDRQQSAENLLRDAAESTAVPAGELQVLFVLAARVPRVAWKYESIAYALILKHVGVVYQTMYLVATAMGLAACAVGGGDADLFARATGCKYVAEASVGEFLLGSRRESFDSETF